MQHISSTTISSFSVWLLSNNSVLAFNLNVPFISHLSLPLGLPPPFGFKFLKTPSFHACPLSLSLQGSALGRSLAEQHYSPKGRPPLWAFKLLPKFQLLLKTPYCLCAFISTNEIVHLALLYFIPRIISVVSTPPPPWPVLRNLPRASNGMNLTEISPPPIS